MASVLLEPSVSHPQPLAADLLPPDSPSTEQSPGDGHALDRVESNISTFTDSKSDVTTNGNPDGIPPPKTDKPRPHVCTTCGRSFARLEHLKRHERSHTKEKPFECPECTRCFARRDLLLRHQQKLHMTTTPSVKPRNGRRESATALGPNGSHKVRKGSMVGASGQHPMRPRANTISHIDGGALGMFTANASPHAANLPMNHPGFNRAFSFQADTGMPPHQQQQQQQQQPHHPHPQPPMQGQMHGHNHLLPRIATQNLQNLDPHATLRTAPAGGHFGGDFDQVFTAAAGSTINPAQLHVGDANGNQSPFGNPFPLSAAIMEDEDNYDWMRGFNAQMTFAPHESALDGSSPSAMSTDSPLPHASQADAPGSHMQQQQWQMQQQQQQAQMMGSHDLSNTPNPFGFEQQNGPTFSDLGHVLSPANLQNHVDQMDGLYSQDHAPHSHFQHLQMHQPMQFGSDITSISSASLNSTGRHSSITTISTDSITDVTRQALLMSLAQPSAYGHGAFSRPSVSSPLSPRDRASGSPSFPSTFDLQRYVNAYIRYFHPHFPFLHIPTLSFDSPAYTSHLRTTGGQGHGIGNTVGGGGCLILAMSAIGALYETDRPASKELFDASKKMIQLYLEERRKADASASANSPRAAGELVAENTPLWLVQAMLLNVIYGHQCGDKVANDIASTHCIALVSLARAAELVKPLPDANAGHFMPDMHLSDEHSWALGDDSQWRKWIGVEERKRTLFAIFHMSSLLVSAYNHAPALMNSEIQLDLPCDEDLWNADSAQTWSAKGGAAAEQNSIPFAHALRTLLTASHHPPDQYGYHNSHHNPVPQPELKPSTFGCLVLINALHNYIWETRQRHSGRRWTTQETEAMQAHIEPALRAWQSAWAANPMHSLERPNPFGMGPLSADSIPLLDLAYVRLFVNLGSSKEALWQRDFDAMAEELARGTEIIQHAEYSEGNTTGENSAVASRNSPEPGMDIKIPRTPTDDFSMMNGHGSHGKPQSSKRERHLRKAALYAADSLSMSEKLGVTYADFTSRELPVQSAICALDCAQVLAEWVATVQERVGRFLGILGRDNIDFTQVPAIVMLEDEDVRLLEKIHDIAHKAESKMRIEGGALSAAAAQAMYQIPTTNGSEGYGSKILLLTAFMLERGAVWPIQSIMSQGLTVQSAHMSKRADLSVATR